MSKRSISYFEQGISLPEGVEVVSEEQKLFAQTEELSKDETLFCTKKSKITGKERPVLNELNKQAINDHYKEILNFFAGDLKKVKEYAIAFGRVQKKKYQDKYILESSYKKASLISSSLIGKATYEVFRNFATVEKQREVTKKHTGIRGFFKKRAILRRDIREISDLNKVEVTRKQAKIIKESKNITTEEIWDSSQAYGKAREKLHGYLNKQREVLDQESRFLLEEVGIEPKKLKTIKKKLRKKTISVRRKLALGAMAIGFSLSGLRGISSRNNESVFDSHVAKIKQFFNNEWRGGEHQSGESGLTEEPTSSDASQGVNISSPNENENNQEIKKVETMSVLQEFYKTTVYPQRISHLESLSTTERLKIFEAIGGSENIDNGKIVIGILGKDTDGNRYGVDKNGRPLGRNDQTIVVIFDIKNNKITTVSLPRDMALPTNMYGEATPKTLNGLTWINQHHSTEGGGYVPLNREIAQKVLTDAVGYYVDGTMEFNFESASQLVDALFPSGIELEVKDSFVPENEDLGKISGYRKNGYKSFTAGERYIFDGEGVVALLRARKTRKEGTYQREASASDLITNLINEMLERYLVAKSPEDLAEKIQSMVKLIKLTQGLEESGDLDGHFWGNRLLPTDFVMEFIKNTDISTIWKLIQSHRKYGNSILPKMLRVSPKTADMVAAPWFDHKVVFSSGIDLDNSRLQQEDPMKFWSDIREMVSLVTK